MSLKRTPVPKAAGTPGALRVKRTPVGRLTPDKRSARDLLSRLAQSSPSGNVESDLSDGGEEQEQKGEDAADAAPAYVTPEGLQGEFFPDSDDSRQQQHNEAMYERIMQRKGVRMKHTETRRTTRAGRTGMWTSVPRKPRLDVLLGSPRSPIDSSWRKETVPPRPKLPRREPRAITLSGSPLSEPSQIRTLLAMFVQAVKAKRLGPLLADPPLVLSEEELGEFDYSPVDWLVSELHKLAGVFLVHIEHLACPVEIIATLTAMAPDPTVDLDRLERERELITLAGNDNDMDKTFQRFLAVELMIEKAGGTKSSEAAFVRRLVKSVQHDVVHGGHVDDDGDLEGGRGSGQEESGRRFDTPEGNCGNAWVCYGVPHRDQVWPGSGRATGR